MQMREKARELAVKFLLIAATCVAVMGYHFTTNYAFVALPFLAGVALILLFLRRPTQLQDSQAQSIMKMRRHALMQLLISSLVVLSFGGYYLVIEGDMDTVLGYAIMLAALVPLGLMAYLTKTLVPVNRPSRAGGGR